MKRGLKVELLSIMTATSMRSNLCPDEKGTESKQSHDTLKNLLSSNLCPDEKGTERSYEQQRILVFLR